MNLGLSDWINQKNQLLNKSLLKDLETLNKTIEKSEINSNKFHQILTTILRDQYNYYPAFGNVSFKDDFDKLYEAINNFHDNNHSQEYLIHVERPQYTHETKQTIVLEVSYSQSKVNSAKLYCNKIELTQDSRVVLSNKSLQFILSQLSIIITHLTTKAEVGVSWLEISLAKNKSLFNNDSEAYAKLMNSFNRVTYYKFLSKENSFIISSIDNKDNINICFEHNTSNREEKAIEITSLLTSLYLIPLCIYNHNFKTMESMPKLSSAPVLTSEDGHTLNISNITITSLFPEIKTLLDIPCKEVFLAYEDLDNNKKYNCSLILQYFKEIFKYWADANFSKAVAEIYKIHELLRSYPRMNTNSKIERKIRNATFHAVDKDNENKVFDNKYFWMIQSQKNQLPKSLINIRKSFTYWLTRSET